MNALLGKDRAIVAEIAGTTRDVLEADLRLSGLHFKLVDTAGIRETEEVVEKEGIRRSKEAMGQADLVLLVLDAARGVSQEEQELIASAPEKKTVLVWNKVDLPATETKPEEAVGVSAKMGLGLDDLRHAIDRLIWKKGPPSKEEIVITSARHQQALDSAGQCLGKLIEGLLSGVSAEFCASDMRQALRELGTIIGADIQEDILSSIFSKFCVGK